jgi:hypothetical protein
MLLRYSCDLRFVATGLVQNHAACRRQKSVMSQRAIVLRINCEVSSSRSLGAANFLAERVRLTRAILALALRVALRASKIAPGDFVELVTSWRRGWDSNPRSDRSDAGFQDRCIQPLCHLSELQPSVRAAILPDNKCPRPAAGPLNSGLQPLYQPQPGYTGALLAGVLK